MNEAWPTVKLGDIAEVTSSKRIKMADYVKSGVPFYRSKEIIERSKGNSISTELFITEEYFSAIDQKFGSPSQGDILLTSVGTLGVPYQVKEGDRFYFKDGNLTWFRNYKPDIDADFLLCWLTSSIAKRRFDEVTIGSTQKALTIIALKSIDITLPPLAEQKSIASVLGALNDKIENNRRMNETLEEMARAIFKSWFVDFDPVHAKAAGNAPAYMDAKTASLFPSSFGDDGLPVGWSKEELTSYAILNSKSHSARNAPEEVWYADLANTKNGVIENVEHYTWLDAPSRAKRILQEGDTIVGTVRPGNRSFAYIGRSDSLITGSTGFAVLTPKKDVFREFIYCAATSDENIDRLSHLADGGAYPAVRPNVVSETPVTISSENLMLAFHLQTADLLTKATTNILENQTLVELRDTLLPILMSGEIRVSDAEQEVEAAV